MSAIKRLTTIETKVKFGLSDKDLKELREDGLDYYMISGAYYYEYDKIVEALK